MSINHLCGVEQQNSQSEEALGRDLFVSCLVLVEIISDRLFCIVFLFGFSSFWSYFLLTFLRICRHSVCQ